MNMIITRLLRSKRKSKPIQVEVYTRAMLLLR